MRHRGQARRRCGRHNLVDEESSRSARGVRLSPRCRRGRRSSMAGWHVRRTGGRSAVRWSARCCGSTREKPRQLGVQRRAFSPAQAQDAEQRYLKRPRLGSCCTARE